MHGTTHHGRSWPAFALAGAAILVIACTERPAEAPAPPPPRTGTKAHEAAKQPRTEQAPAAAQPRIGLRTLASGLVHPVAAVTPPDGSRRIFVVDQIGLIRIITAEGALLPEPFLDLRDRLVPLDPEYDERGLLGLAFHPDYAKNGRFVVYYSAPLRPDAPAGWNHTNKVAALRVSATRPDRADPASERVILAVDHPQMNHNGGSIAFGPKDGYLYIPIGDGGGAGDRDMGHTPVIGNGQDRSKLLGKILRIDVNGAFPYELPKDNPLVGQAGAAPEIYAYGLRNPWRIAFDPGGDHRLFAPDVGQELWEEVDIIEAGGNYGWPIREGTHCFNQQRFREPPRSCPTTSPWGAPLLPPVIEIPNSAQRGGVGAAIVGGEVYRGATIPELAGKYVFGVWTTSSEDHAPRGALLAAGGEGAGAGLWRTERLVAPGPEGTIGSFLLGFGRDADGEVLALVADTHGPTGETGKVLKLVPADPN